MTAAELAESASRDTSLPAGLSDEARALWLVKKGRWESAHQIAQEIHTPLGSWIHALLHLIEGDLGNADYWFTMARKPSSRDIDALWDEISEVVLSS